MTRSDLLLQRLETEVRPVVRRLLAEPLCSPADLREGVFEHLDVLEHEHRRNEFIDLSKARRVAARCLRLLDGFDGGSGDGETVDPEIHRLVQVAARYFAIEDDADDDLSLAGIDDDESVIAAVEALLGVVS